MKRKKTKSPESKNIGTVLVRCAYDKLEPLAGLKPHPRNPNKHSSAQISLLAKILQVQGWRLPIVVSKRSGLIVAGHARLAAGLELGIEKGPVNFQNFDSDEQELAHLVADNKIAELAETDDATLKQLIKDLGETDLDLALLGLGDDLERILAELNPQEPDDAHAAELMDKAAELQKKWKTKLGQIWELGEHRLMCGDSTSKESATNLMIGEKAEFLFTSPPYSNMRDYKGCDNNVSKISDFIPAFAQYSEYLAFNLGIQRKDHSIIEYWIEYLDKAKATGKLFLSWNVWWKKTISVGQQTAFFPIEHEFIFVFGNAFKDINRTMKRKSDITSNISTTRRQRDGSVKISSIGEQETKKEMGSVFHSSPELGQNRKSHPATFPVELPSAYIAAVTNHADSVIDPFSGSGTTLIACEQLSRRCRAMEIDPGYVAVALQRWSDLTKKTPKLIK